MDHRAGCVAVVGAPNVGKSTLVNKLLGHKLAIVSPRPQTTRHRLLGILTHPEYQIAFVDTPGIAEPRRRLGRALLAAASDALEGADVVLFVVDGSRLPGEADRRVSAMVTGTGVPVLLVLNKMDRLKPERVQAHCDAYWALAPGAPWMMTTATSGHNVEKLLGVLVPLLPESPPLYPEDQFTDATERFLASELIREQVLLRTRQEVPHGAAVVVDRWEERQEGLTYIAATIYVERDGQKAIVVGKGGQMLKQIGSAARAGIEEMIGGRTYIELWVKVKPGWRDRAGSIHELEPDT
jgi:GTP-binding protein Era